MAICCVIYYELHTFHGVGQFISEYDENTRYIYRLAWTHNENRRNACFNDALCASHLQLCLPLYNLRIVLESPAHL